jgi:hypothetical protein
LQAVYSLRQYRFLNKQARQTFLDGIFKPAALANQTIGLLIQSRAARWIKGAPKNLEKLFTNHAPTARIRTCWPI